MDVKAKVMELVDQLTKDAGLKEQFLSDPVRVVEKLIGKDIPDDVVEKIVEGVKAKLNIDSAKGAIDKLKKLF